MNLDRAVLAFAGCVVLLTAFAGLNMLQAAFTGLCPAAMIFKAAGVKEGCAFK